MHPRSDYRESQAPTSADADGLRMAEQLVNLQEERRKYASGIYRIQPDRLSGILAGIDRDIDRILASMNVTDSRPSKF